MPVTHVALLRGINVGGRNKLPMSDLRDLFIEAGCRDVQTWIQSGNVLFQAEPGIAASLSDTVTKRIAERFRYRVPVVLRATEEMRDVIRHNPWQGIAEDELHVLFLADEPAAGQVDRLDPDRSPPDAFILQGREIYLRLPKGMGRTKLTNDYFDTKLATTSTARNWRTVTKLLALMEA
jgi:uncharacterized protein (DUF1697 family)